MNHWSGQPALLVNKRPNSIFMPLFLRRVGVKAEHYKSNAKVKSKPILAAKVKKKIFEIKLHCAFSVYLYRPGVYRLLKVVEAILKHCCVFLSNFCFMKPVRVVFAAASNCFSGSCDA